MKNNHPQVCIIAARVREEIIARLIQGALRACHEENIPADNILIIRVNGALELPHALHRAMKSPFLDAFVTLGAVLKGATDHYDHVARLANNGVHEVAILHDKPIGNGILTVHHMEHAVERSQENDDNLGYIAAKASLDLWRSLNAIDCFRPKSAESLALPL